MSGPSSTARVILLQAAAAAAALAVFGLIGVGCSEDDALPYLPGGSTPGEPLSPNRSCSSGASRDCSVELEEVDGVFSCYKGSQTCEGGRWSACGDGHLSSFHGTRLQLVARLQALGAPAACLDDPCDPFCQRYDEIPDSGLTAVETDPIFDWPGGPVSLDGYPGPLVDRGLNQPCATGADCQFSHRCENPRTDASCAHGKCAPGIALAADCDPCVAEVCAEDASCCEAGVGATCDHSPCSWGAPLKAACDPCVASICATRPSCCDENGWWSSSCVELVATECGVSCPCGPGEVQLGSSCYYLNPVERAWQGARTACQARGDGWDLAVIESEEENTFVWFRSAGQDTWIGLNDRGNENEGTFSWANGSTASYRAWSPGEPNNFNNEDCVHLLGNGDWNDAHCSYETDSMCEGPTRHQSGWSEACVGLAERVCDVQCKDPGQETGHCVAWLPGETDGSCEGIDLAGGVPCDDEGGVVPVCNHGTTTAPAGIRIVHFPEGSGQYPRCGPDTSADGVEECFTTEPIAPGECVSVSDCPGLTGGREIMVNPPGDAHVEECSCLDNWTLYDAAVELPACAPPQCFTRALSPEGSCSLDLANGEVLDIETALVSYVAASGDATPLARVADEGACGNGWYYDDPEAPTRLTLCPSTCSALTTSGGDSVQVEIDCLRYLSPVTVTEVYEATCEAGTSPLWKFFSYDTITPRDSRVVFRARTAPTEAELAASGYLDLATAAADPDTQVCALSGPAPCPINVFAALGGRPTATQRFLELEATLTPTSDRRSGPTFNEWQLTYSCPPAD